VAESARPLNLLSLDFARDLPFDFAQDLPFDFAQDMPFDFAQDMLAHREGGR
jgi:hypothetical protein